MKNTNPKHKAKDNARKGKAPAAEGPAEMVQVVSLPTEALDESPLNPRRRYDEDQLAELAQSLATAGMVHPMLVRPAGPDRWEVVAGHRRLRAARLAGLRRVPAIARAMTDDAALDIMMCENLQRADLSPMEEARGYQAMMRMEAGSRYPTAAAVAARVGRSAMHVGRILSLLRLPPEVQGALETGQISARVAAEIARVPGAAQREDLGRRVLSYQVETGEDEPEERMTVAQVRGIIERDFCVSLSRAPFSLADDELVGPAYESEGGVGTRISGGACEDCPANSAVGDAGRRGPQMCSVPACYRAKVAALNRMEVQAAVAKGIEVVPAEQAVRYVYKFDGTPLPGWVDVREKPTADVLAPGSGDVPAWEDMIGGSVDRRLVLPETGPARYLARQEEAIAAARAAGWAHVLVHQADGERHSKSDELAERRAKVAAELRWATGQREAMLDAIVAAVREQGVRAEVWEVIVTCLLGWALDWEAVLRRRGWQAVYDGPREFEDELAAAVRSSGVCGDPQEAAALAMEVLFSQVEVDVKGPGVAEFGAVYGIDWDTVLAAPASEGEEEEA